MAREDIKDFFNKDFARTTVGTLVGAMVAFLAYYLLKRWEGKQQGELAQKKQARRLDYLSSLVERSFDQVKSTSLEIQKAAESLGNNPALMYDLQLPPNSALNRLQEVLEKEEYHDAYLNVIGETESSSYDQLVSTTEFLLNQRQRLQELTQLALGEDTKRKSAFISMVYDLLKRGMELVQQPGLLDEEEILLINRIYDNYYESFVDYSDIDYHQQQFVLPMLETALEPYTDRLPVLELATGFKTARNLYEDIKTRNLGYRQELLSFVSTYHSNELLFESGMQDLMDRKQAASEETKAETKKEPNSNGENKSRKARKEEAA